MESKFIFKPIKKKQGDFRPLSNSLITKLKECDKIEQEGKEDKNCTIGKMYYSMAPLYKRGLIQIRRETVNNKTFHCVYLTNEGKQYLESLKYG